MSCANCENMQETGSVFPYRWKAATVLLQACREHAKEIFEILNAAQIARDVGIVPPCGGSRCWRAEDGSWVHSSKSYGSCSAVPK